MAQQVQNSSLQECYVPNHLAMETREGEISALGSQVVRNSAEDVKELQDLCTETVLRNCSASPFEALLGVVLLIAGIVSSIVFPPLLPLFLVFGVFPGIAFILDATFREVDASKFSEIKDALRSGELVDYANKNKLQLKGSLPIDPMSMDPPSLGWRDRENTAKRNRLRHIFDNYCKSKRLAYSNQHLENPCHGLGNILEGAAAS